MIGRVNSKLHTIGEVSRMSGVPVKTIRYYSDIGLLPPSDVTEAGYRLYSDADVVRLELVRTLRMVDFDLPTVSRLLQGEVRPQAAVEMQLGALEVQMRALRRQQAVLRAALKNAEGKEQAMLTNLKGLQSLSQLARLEREAFLREHLSRRLEDIPGDPQWKSGLVQMALADFPDEMDEAQFEAWLELASLVSDESFLTRIGEQSRPFWEAAEGRFDMEAWQAIIGEVFGAAMQAVQEGRSPGGADEQQVVEKWVEANARILGSMPDAEFERSLLAQNNQAADPQAQRFWELVGIIRRSEEHIGLYNRAYYWLLEGIRLRVEGKVAVDGDAAGS